MGPFLPETSSATLPEGMGASPLNNGPSLYTNLLSSDSGSFTRSRHCPILECCESTYLSAEPDEQLFSPASILDSRMDYLFSEGEDECPQTPKENRIPPALHCPGAPLKPRPVRRLKSTDGKRTGISVLTANIEATSPDDGGLKQQRSKRRLWRAQQLLDQALRS
jgi:hypothetical protein